MKKALILCIAFINNALAQNNFPPPPVLKQVGAVKITNYLKIDGILNEPEWATAKSIDSLVQVEPYQGTKPTEQTTVKILYNDKYFYLGAFCRDSFGLKKLRVQNLARDFDFFENDLIGIQFDCFKTKRNAVTFQTTPYGAQRDMQVFDDNIKDPDWDALWKVRTMRTDSGWYAEFAIPFITLRYPKSDGDTNSWNFNIIRTIRRNFEITAFPGYPRSFSPYRMSYVASLTNINPPKSGKNLRIVPYVNYQAAQIKIGDSTAFEQKPKFGGELKWAPNANSVLDLTVNTDFAQADADRQVINLKRFSVFFPERRQFFLENSGIYSPGVDGSLKPFYSRSVGLDMFGNPIPIDAGARFTSRHTKYNSGIMVLRQRGDSINPDSYVAVGRYQQNYGEQNNIGVLITNKYDAFRKGGTQPYNNFTATIDGLHRFNQKLSIEYLYTHSVNSDTTIQQGDAGSLSIGYNANNGSLTTRHTLITERYNPSLGFVSRNNLIEHNPGGYFIIRKKWFPKFIRSYEPGAFAFIYQSQKDYSFQEAYVNVFLCYLLFSNGGSLDLTYQPNWQNLPVDFYPVDVLIPKGNYMYNRAWVDYSTDRSKKVSLSLGGSTGGYFNGYQNELTAGLRFAPIPHIAMRVDYEYNQFRNLGLYKQNLETQLITANVRLALNPRVQLTGFYQYNTFTEKTRWNVRLSWEYQPLSYIYLVYNNFKYPYSIADKTLFNEQQTIFKVTYLKQF